MAYGIFYRYMMNFGRRIMDELNFRKQAQELGVSIWQIPNVLFMFMGLVIIVAMTGVYFSAKHYDSIELVVLSESAVVAIMFTIGNVMIRSVEEIAKANRMKTEFVSIASHQLKTPLTEISWEIELLVSKYKEGLTGEQLDLIKNIDNSNAKMARLVNDLLDVARIDQGRLMLVKEKVDMASVIKDVIAESEVLAQSRGVNVSYKCSTRFPRVMGDKRRIGVVLDNLISNGIKYSKEDGLVDVTVRRVKDKAQVCIKDNGVGIPRRQQDKVFQKFFRSDNVTKTQTDGTGLGLYIAKNIIEQSGGKIWFKSDEGIGTTFWFSLPLYENNSLVRRVGIKR